MLIPEEAKSVLRSKYATTPMGELERTLGQPSWKIQKWARSLHLRRSLKAPINYEFLKELAKRAGFDARTMKRILRWAGVPLIPTFRSRTFVVSTRKANYAIKRWLTCELLSDAARRHGIHYRVLHRIFKHHRDYKRPGKWKRIPTVDIDEAVRGLR